MFIISGLTTEEAAMVYEDEKDRAVLVQAEMDLRAAAYGGHEDDVSKDDASFKEHA